MVGYPAPIITTKNWREECFAVIVRWQQLARKWLRKESIVSKNFPLNCYVDMRFQSYCVYFLVRLFWMSYFNFFLFFGLSFFLKEIVISLVNLKLKKFKKLKKDNQKSLSKTHIIQNSWRLCPQHFASLFCMPKREHFWNKENYFLFLFKSYFFPWYNQILTFKVFKCNVVMKCLSMKQESTFYWITWKVNTVWY